MSVRVLLITHSKVGEALVHAVGSAIGDLPLPTTVIPVDHQTDPDILTGQIQHYIDKIPNDEGVLVLTDLFGATPSNIASRIQCQNRIRVIAGLNLPMLFKVMNYPHVGLSELAGKAVSGGKEGVINCTKDNHDPKNSNHH